MPSLTDPTNETAKILLIGDQGRGKTGAKASLVATGYKLRMIDTDNGFKLLRALLTDEEHYPYASYMKKHNITPDISYIPIDVPIDFVTYTATVAGQRKTFENVLGPTSSNSWKQIIDLLREWKDNGTSFGSITDWDNDTVLDFDTISTAAELAKYWTQDLNSHLGSLNDEHGRDTGAAQEMIMRLMMKMANPSVRCNVIGTCHVKYSDVSIEGLPQSIGQRLRDKKSIDPKGFPQIIGQATGPYVGKRVNDVFVVDRDGHGRNAERRIYASPINNIDTKNSVWLEESYSVETGLAQIFNALRYKQPPIEFLEHCKKFHENNNTNGTNRSSQAPKSSSGGFGSN